LYGLFEEAEIRYLCSKVKPESTVIDIGANVGLFTVALARKIEATGKVLSFEPLPSNISRLKQNLTRNRLNNVNIFPIALGDIDGTVLLYLANDPAYSTTTGVVAENRGTGETMVVEVARLDRIWREIGSPNVSAIKIDVDGGELAVITGAQELLANCAPLLLVEANTSKNVNELVHCLSKHGYTRIQPAGFCPWNHVFLSNKAKN
jgi:FkbM family methyltransferase